MKKNKNIWKFISILIILIIFIKVSYEYYDKNFNNNIKHKLIFNNEVKENKSNQQKQLTNKIIENQKKIITEEQIKEMPEIPNFYYRK